MIKRFVNTQDPNWMRTHWRPMMAFVYMAIVLFDFIFGPIFWSIIQLFGGSLATQWIPLTLTSGGVFHAAMGGVLGISAFTRGKEKIEEIKTSLHNPTQHTNSNVARNDYVGEDTLN